MKAAIVVDQAQPKGLLANTAAVLGVSLGAIHSEIIGPAIADASGTIHPGITGLPIPILAATDVKIAELIVSARGAADLVCVPFNALAQRCTDYADYTDKLSTRNSEELAYVGVLLVGGKRSVATLVGSLPLVR